jgi:hypothetical protein
MAVISITITESELQKYAGIPATIELSTNIPATIFYTLDGSDPDVNSDVYVGPITMPGHGQVTFKVWATDGLSTSQIVTEVYGTTTVPNRDPRDKVTGIETVPRGATFPFGSPVPAPGVNGIYGNTGGITVDNPLIPGYPSGWDGTATQTPASETNLPPDTASHLTPYDWVFSETNAIGARGRGIGTLPANVTKIIDNTNDAPLTSQAESPLFNPKAMVIYQDSRIEPYDKDVPQLNRSYFNLENPNRARDGRLLGVTEGISPTGSMLKSQYNPRDNTITFYYYDNRATRWIISKEPYTPHAGLFDYSRIIFPSRGKPTAGFVFKWLPFRYRRLF